MRLIDRIRQHPAVDVLLDERPEGWFVYLKPGWVWSEQRGFGCETLTETWSLVRQCERSDVIIP